MMRIYSLMFFLCGTICCIAQIGVNSSLPLQEFHVDGKKNTPIDRVPTNEEVKDDFVVTKEGNVGIGTLNPSTRLEVNGNIQLLNGSTSNNKKVLTSDGSGLVSLLNLPEVNSTIVGKFEGGAVTNAANASGYLFANATIVLQKGKWIVNWGLTIDNRTNNTFWLESALSSSKTALQNTNFVFLGPYGNQSIGGTLIARPTGSTSGNYSFLSGSNIIEVTVDELTIYIMLKKDGNWSYGSGSWENYLYAMPMK